MKAPADVKFNGRALEWPLVEGAARYQLSYKKKTFFGGGPTTKVTLSDNWYPFTEEVEWGTTYNVKVRGIKGNVFTGEKGPWSRSVKIKVPLHGSLTHLLRGD